MRPKTDLKCNAKNCLGPRVSRLQTLKQKKKDALLSHWGKSCKVTQCGESGFVAGKQVPRTGSLVTKIRPQHFLSSPGLITARQGEQRSLISAAMSYSPQSVYDTVRVTDTVNGNNQESEGQPSDDVE